MEIKKKKWEIRVKKKLVTGYYIIIYIETMAFNNRSYKRLCAGKRNGGGTWRSDRELTAAAGNRYPPCNYRLVSLSVRVYMIIVSPVIRTRVRRRQPSGRQSPTIIIKIKSCLCTSQFCYLFARLKHIQCIYICIYIENKNN